MMAENSVASTLEAVVLVVVSLMMIVISMTTDITIAGSTTPPVFSLATGANTHYWCLLSGHHG